MSIWMALGDNLRHYERIDNRKTPYHWKALTDQELLEMRVRLRKGLVSLSPHWIWRPAKRRPLIRWPGWPRAWSLLTFILSEAIEERVYQPAMVELLRKHSERVRYRTKGARRWINFCFALRTLLLVGECLVLLVPSGIASLVRAWLSK